MLLPDFSFTEAAVGNYASRAGIGAPSVTQPLPSDWPVASIPKVSTGPRWLLELQPSRCLSSRGRGRKAKRRIAFLGVSFISAACVDTPPNTLITSPWLEPGPPR